MKKSLGSQMGPAAGDCYLRSVGQCLPYTCHEVPCVESRESFGQAFTVGILGVSSHECRSLVPGTSVLGNTRREVILSETTAKEVALQCPEHLAKAT